MSNRKGEKIMRKRRRHLKRSVKIGMLGMFVSVCSLCCFININTFAKDNSHTKMSVPKFEQVSVEKYGIDVSKWNGVINWELVKSDSEISYAIIRCGVGPDDTKWDDPRWMYNADECTRLDIPFGVYLYSYATSKEDAKSEAEHVLRLVEEYELDYPIYFDMEDERQECLSADELGDIAKTFCDTIQTAGYDVGIYSNTYWYNNVLIDPVFDQYKKWCAQYNESCTYQGNYTMWQYSDKGQIPGIDSYVDLNVSYEEEIRIKE